MPDEHQTEQSEPETQHPEQPQASAPSNPADGPDDTTADAATGTSAGSEEDGSEPSVNLDAVLRQRDDYYDRLLRITAEFDNYRKRTERERRDLIAHAAGDLLGDLLPVVDDFERALAADGQDGPAYRQGVEIIQKQLLDVMTRHGVSPIEAVGTDFDPLKHQAVTHEASESHRDGEVIEELRRGYTLRDRLLRPSMVKVAKA